MGEITKNHVLNHVLYDAFSESASSVYLYVTDTETNISRWSKNAVKYFGLPSEFIKDSVSMWLEHIHPRDQADFICDINKVMEGTASSHFSQYRARNAKGEYVWVECHGKMVVSANGEKVFAGMITRIDNPTDFDSLTGLPSKNRLYQYDFENTKGYVCLLGIDLFRQVINTYGYERGDEIISFIGRTILEANNPRYKAFHFDGDEFVFVIPDAEDEKEVQELFQYGVDSFKTLLLRNGTKVELSFTCSCIKFPFENSNAVTIINKLETILFYAKKDCRGQLVFYSQEIEKKIKRQQLLKKELSDSIKNNFSGFELYYQPWMSSDGKEIIGCEALLRWKGETIKDSNPMEFISVLEETGDIIAVGHFVMEEAMKQQKEWESKYGDLIVSFNVSYSQFLVEGYAEDLIDTAKKYGVNPNAMVIELTESCHVQAPRLLASVFSKLRAYGFKLALDDFGTGYASLEMFRMLPSDGVKIDHSFVRELAKEGHDIDLAIIDSILNMCEKLGQQVVIEGVENEEVDSIIKSFNCGYLQGYYYSKPVSKDVFESFLKKK